MSFMSHIHVYIYLKFSDCNDIYEFCFSADFLKQAESLYNELDLTGRGMRLKLMVEMLTFNFRVLL